MGQSPNGLGGRVGQAPIPGAFQHPNLALMGNSLLDFVMALVRDPEVSARYAADPAAVLAAANLPGVTLADVNNLIPVVTDSLAAAAPGFGATADPGNVWASGAAAAAFDAFDVTVPVRTELPERLLPAVTPPVESPPIAAGPVPDLDQTPVPAQPEPMAPDWPGEEAWNQQHGGLPTEYDPGDPSGFDLL